ncbi:hypothetical protein BD324DRAFT_617828 [Kockovaella imperatae]|uniref:COP9 signalosome complex subunit 6 n=1 Tax=Kockovaella imperatae TaxID=4999 RepID=A0A1Y1ULH1_9TREE|nr:hypothetical protein BD324DRAFT_617828 [Kockovaella imperatae]ORX38898.1 hypothetical protein BD324DRAFT_617828 [Kockovaella imperatae]
MDAGPSKSSTQPEPVDSLISSESGSGLNISLHPLPILNISDHYTRARLTSPDHPEKLIGALLGTQSNRDVSISNSFELVYQMEHGAAGGDVDMSEGANRSPNKGSNLNIDFLTRRGDDFKEVFPTLDIVGWYTIGQTPTADHARLHRQFLEKVDSPLFLLFDPSQLGDGLPFSVYEASFADTSSSSTFTAAGTKFIKLDYAIETGEAERIAVDGISRGDAGAQGDESGVVGNLTTLRNAIGMLHERISILTAYITGVINKTAEPDQSILRQLSSLVSSLPTIDSVGFQEEFMTVRCDRHRLSYLIVDLISSCRNTAMFNWPNTYQA